jgi:O-antigen/teichoic acid export membrane protein
MFRSLLRHSAAYSVPVLLGKMCSFILLPVYTRYLSPSDYGVLELLDLTSFVLTSLLGARLGDALCYFYAEAATDEARDTAATTAFLTALAMGAAGALAGFLFTAPLGRLVFATTAYSPYFHLAFANFILVMPQEAGLAYLRARNRSGLFTLFLSVRLFVAIFFNVLFLAVWSMGIRAMLWSTLVASAVMALGLAFIVFSNARMAFDWALCRRMVSYTVPIGVGGVAMLVIHYGDRFFLQRSASLADVGIYSLAYKLGMLVSYAQLPFATYWTSQMYRIVRGDRGEAINARVCTYLLLALSTVAVTITVFSRPALGLLTTPAFRVAAQFIPLITAAYVIRGLGDQFRNVFFIENRTGSDAQTSTVGSILCLAGYALLIPPFKMWGAAAATLGAFIGLAFYSYWKSQRIKKYHYEWQRLAKIGFSALAASAVAIAVAPEGIGAQFLVGAGGLLVYLVLLATSGFFTREEIETVKEAQDYLLQRAARAVGAL